jgi:tripartite-type tricarboxylate transporter receptor subunit TctC
MPTTLLPRRQLILAMAAALSGALVPRKASAQLHQKTARFVVGFPAGGTTDAFARLCADKLRGRYAPTVLVETRAGAAGRIALTNVNGGDVDGSTAFLAPCSLLTIYPHVYKKLSYDPVRDFSPVCTIARGDFALSVGPMVPDTVKTLDGLVAWFKANPKQAFFASPAAGATPHFVGDMFARAAGLDLTHATYKGDAPAVQDLLGGQVACGVNNIGVVLPHVKDGRLRLLATSGAGRSRFTPDVPTFVEAGFREVVAQEWFGLFLPSKALPEVVAALASAMGEVARLPDVVQRISDFAFEPASVTTAEFARLLDTERGRWAKVVKASGFQIDE